MGFAKITLEQNSARGNTARVITELGIGNFKAFGEMQRVPIKPLTLIFGANCSGKSSILHALLLAHHGMETGEYDAHQTKLAGDMVDLGGFRNYVHKHDLSQPVRLCLETDIDREALWEHLDGEPEERLPFIKLPQFGLVSRFGLTLTLVGSEPTLVEVAVLLNQRPILAFLRSASGKFKAQPPLGSGAYFSLLGKSLMEFESTRAARGGVASEFLPEAMGRDLSPQDIELKDQRIKEAVEGVRRQFASGQTPNADDLAQFNEVFAKAITEDGFSLEKLVLRDPRQEDLRNWPVGREQLAEGAFNGLLGFFKEIGSWYGPDSFVNALARELGGKDAASPRSPAKPPWWAEAQAVRHNLSNLIEYCSGRIADVLFRISYLGPSRCVPARYASLEGALDARALASGSAAWDEIRRNPRVLEAVNRWLGVERLRMPYGLKSLQFLDADRLRLALRGYEANAESLVQKLAETPDSSVLVFEDANAGTTVTHRDIGFGVSQVLPVLVNAAAMRERLIAVEQPELHLHPAQQAELGDVFIESALGERKNTFLLETHSEHLILRILRRVRETTEGKLPVGATPVRPEDVSVVFVEPAAKGAVVRHLPVTPDGDFGAPWPGGFFAERFQDLP